MKICNTCKIEKPFTDFYKRKDAYKDPYRSDCNACLKIKAANRYKKNPDQFNARSRRWRELNPDKEKKRGFVWRENNKEKTNQKTKRWRDKNLERVRLIVQKSSRKHPETARIGCARRRARKKNAMPGWLTKKHKKAIKEIYQLAINLSKKTGIEYHVDHIIPLANENVCGLHVPWNLQIITAEENHKKHNKFYPFST